MRTIQEESGPRPADGRTQECLGILRSEGRNREWAVQNLVFAAQENGATHVSVQQVEPSASGAIALGRAYRVAAEPFYAACPKVLPLSEPAGTLVRLTLRGGGVIECMLKGETAYDPFWGFPVSLLATSCGLYPPLTAKLSIGGIIAKGAVPNLEQRKNRQNSQDMILQPGRYVHFSTNGYNDLRWRGVGVVRAVEIGSLR